MTITGATGREGFEQDIAASDVALLRHVPVGTTVLEASAGTGKTHELASIALYAVASGLPLDRVLLVTFTRMATGELRERVWARLVDAERALAEHLATGAPPEDPVVAELAGSDVDTATRRHERLVSALADFDSATIATIHGFCQQVLSRVGFAGDVDREVGFVEDPRELVEAVVDDLLVKKLTRSGPARFTRAEALRLAHLVVSNPDAELLAGEPDQDRLKFASRVRGLVDKRKREAQLIGYDDLLTRLARTLEGVNGDVVRERLQAQFHLVVVDEFQDTDAIQWRILRRAFTGGSSRLVLIGDPKQAIYAFRGADVHAYLAARRDATVRSLEVNWRSDADLLTGLDAVFGDSRLGHDEIAYHRTTAAAHLREPRLVEGLRRTPVRIRVVRRDHPDASLAATTGTVAAGWARDHIAADLAADVVRRLSDGSRLVERDRRNRVIETRPVVPGDLAVLVQRNRDAELVRSALADLGVPAVANATGSIFDSPAADHWVRLLEALESPSATTRVRSLAMTPFVGWSAEQVAVATSEWDRVHSDLHQWRRTLETRGVAAMFAALSSSMSLSRLVLARPDGERLLTDLRHLAEVVHDHQTRTASSVAGLVRWLRSEMRAGRESGADERSRRLDSDADAVQVWTIHRSKGLEFPIVYVPFLWSPGWVPEDDPPVFHAGADDSRYIDVGGRRPEWRRHRDLAEQERRGEELRLAYVALTRARHQVVAWWAPTRDAVRSPLAQLLFAPRAPLGLTDTPSDDGARTVLDLIAADSSGSVAVETATGGDGVAWDQDPPARPDLSARVFARTLDGTWRRTSYSALTAAAHDAPPGSAAPEHDDRGAEDERMDDEAVTVPRDLGTVHPDEARLRDVPSAMADLPGGARFGTFVHSVLERVDFTAPDLEAAIDVAVGAGSGLLERDERPRLVTGLAAAIRTPLGPEVGQRALSEVPMADRLDEMHFEMALAGGDVPQGAVTMGAIADVFARCSDQGGFGPDYAAGLRDPVLATDVRGYLSGAIDVVARIEGRFHVIDHKTNWLGVPGEELSAWHYRPAALREAMARAHYPLQAMIYQVALHRYLRWRLRDYDPEIHLGACLYLFLRGMTGPDTPRVDGAPCGVAAWRPPTEAVLAMSDLLRDGDVAQVSR